MKGETVEKVLDATHPEWRDEMAKLPETMTFKELCSWLDELFIEGARKLCVEAKNVH